MYTGNDRFSLCSRHVRFSAGNLFPNVVARGYCTTSSPLMQLQTCPTKFPNLYHNGVAGLMAHSLLQYTVWSIFTTYIAPPIRSYASSGYTLR